MTYLNRKVIYLMSAVLVMTACGSDVNAPSEESFKSALSQHYTKMRECFSIGNEPNEDGLIYTHRADGTGLAAQDIQAYQALLSVGILETVSFKQDERSFSGTVVGQADYIGYKISKSGETYLRPKELDTALSTGAPQLCFATRKILEITNFTTPSEGSGVTATNVTFTYTLDEIPAWTQNPKIKEVYKSFSGGISQKTLEDNQDLILTNNGWVHHSEYEH